MEREAPIFLHQPIPIRFHEAPILAKKRDFPWQTQNINHSNMPQAGHWIANQNTWNQNLWEWDSQKFIAKPASNSPELPDKSVKVQNMPKKLEVEGQNLALKLGVAEEPVVRPCKRVRAGSPGSSGNYPMCQVDDCKTDLSNAKDYHRRHKVCDIHSKCSNAVVGNHVQRFCQQCSRFHPLSEFDEGKRSCRRRLAGHNRRRRKTQPEDVSSKNASPINNVSNNSTNSNLDIVNLLSIITNLQGNNASKQTDSPALPDKERLIQLISKINTLSNSSSQRSTGLDLNVALPQECVDQSCKTNEHPTASSTVDLLTVLSVAVSNPNALTSLSQGSSYSSGDDKAKTSTDANMTIKQLPKQKLPLQLFDSAEDASPPKVAASVKYLSSECSNPMEDGSPSCSPPAVQKLFPIHSTINEKHERMSVCREDDDNMVETSTSQEWNTRLELFNESNRRAENHAGHNNPYQGGYASSSPSNHSPSSSNSDAQDRTERIIFKLFDKDPSKIPTSLRTQMVNWLAHSPSEMESYIRPGCVVLSIYASMPSIGWDELEEDLHQRVSSLIEDSQSEFWKKGRFLVRTSKQLASHKDGKLRLCKSWKTWSAPEVASVSPIAVVSGQETSLVLKGRNLTIPGTKIHCTFMGKYTSKDVLGSVHPGTVYDDSSFETFTFPGGFPSEFGRCFIEVENGFKGNNFPIIIANSMICQELRSLESEFDDGTRTSDVNSEDQIQYTGQLRSREDLLHFLNELGWLFQRKSSQDPHSLEFSVTRFKFLLTFSVERDWTAVIKMLLDTLVEKSLKSEALTYESLKMLLETQLLSQAVKRKCRKMVDLLLNYYVMMDSSSKVYVFTPYSVCGPDGLTPLHIAASMDDSEDIVDSLTNDPQEIGMNWWDSKLDESGQTPYMYASQRNNHSYNKLVSRKLADKKNGQVSINIAESRRLEVICSKCAFMEKVQGRPMERARGLLGRPYVHSMLAIAAVCVCVCILFRGLPHIGSVAPFKWENLDFGPS